MNELHLTDEMWCVGADECPVPFRGAWSREGGGGSQGRREMRTGTFWAGVTFFLPLHHERLRAAKPSAFIAGRARLLVLVSTRTDTSGAFCCASKSS